jgi:hypothetical protein
LCWKKGGWTLPKIFDQFHVTIPVKAKIRFADLLKNQCAPIFLETLSDKYIVFYSHLNFPFELHGKTLTYLFDFTFFGEPFLIRGHLEEMIADGVIKKYEARLLASEYERTRLYYLLNNYALLLKKLKNKKER